MSFSSLPFDSTLTTAIHQTEAMANPMDIFAIFLSVLNLSLTLFICDYAPRFKRQLPSTDQLFVRAIVKPSEIIVVMSILALGVIGILSIVILFPVPLWIFGGDSQSAWFMTSVLLTATALSIAWMMFFLNTVFRYADTRDRRSDLAERLWSIGNQYELEMTTVLSVLSEDETQRTRSRLELLENSDNQEQLKRHVGPEEFVEIEKNVRRLKRVTQEIITEIESAVSTSPRKIWTFMQSTISFLDDLFGSRGRPVSCILLADGYKSGRAHFCRGFSRLMTQSTTQ